RRVCHASPHRGRPPASRRNPERTSLPMSETKKTVLATRRLPVAVTERLTRTYNARLNPSDTPHDAAKLIELAACADALIVTPSDKITAEVIGKLPDSVRMIATFSVGFEHVDLEAAKRRGIAVSNTPGVLTDATA